MYNMKSQNLRRFRFNNLSLLERLKAFFGVLSAYLILAQLMYNILGQ